jgi:hypothetical protein
MAGRPRAPAPAQVFRSGADYAVLEIYDPVVVGGDTLVGVVSLHEVQPIDDASSSLGRERKRAVIQSWVVTSSVTR